MALPTLEVDWPDGRTLIVEVAKDLVTMEVWHSCGNCVEWERTVRVGEEE